MSQEQKLFPISRATYVLTKIHIQTNFTIALAGMSGDTSTVIQCLKSCATDLTKETARFRVGLANNIFKKLNEQSEPSN